MTALDVQTSDRVPPKAAAPLLRVSQVHKSYRTPEGSVAVLRGVDLDLASGETLALLGESGSGKSTLLHLIGGLDDADSGEIILDGLRIARQSDGQRTTLRRSRVGIVFQQFNLVSSLSVADNLAFQARIADRFDKDWHEALLTRLGLRGLEARYPEQLSGGQQQRVAIGRALAVRPRLLLADEPTGNLDEANGDEVLRLTLDLVAETGAGFLMVTHSTRLAARLHRQVTLASGVVVPQ